MLSYYVIYCEMFRKVLQRTENEALTEMSRLEWIRRVNRTNTTAC